jgi:hypothetical protein
MIVSKIEMILGGKRPERPPSAKSPKAKKESRHSPYPVRRNAQVGS